VKINKNFVILLCCIIIISICSLHVLGFTGESSDGLVKVEHSDMLIHGKQINYDVWNGTINLPLQDINNFNSSNYTGEITTFWNSWVQVDDVSVSYSYATNNFTCDYDFIGSNNDESVLVFLLDDVVISNDTNFLSYDDVSNNGTYISCGVLAYDGEIYGDNYIYSTKLLINTDYNIDFEDYHNPITEKHEITFRIYDIDSNKTLYIDNDDTLKIYTNREILDIRINSSFLDNDTGNYRFDLGYDERAYLFFNIRPECLNGTAIYHQENFIFDYNMMYWGNQDYLRRISEGSENAIMYGMLSRFDYDDYVVYHDFVNRTIPANQLISSTINISSLPDRNKTEMFLVTYEFYSQEGAGELVHTYFNYFRNITGENLTAVFSAEPINPDDNNMTYLVRTNLMYRIGNAWYRFPTQNFGQIVVEEGTYTTTQSVSVLNTAGSGRTYVTTDSSRIYYDVRVYSDKADYKKGENVPVEIKIENKGEYPDRDAVLRVYLENIETGKRYGQIQEFVREAELGVEIQKRVIQPTNDIPEGKYLIIVEYETSVQPLIVSYKEIRIGGFFSLLRIIIGTVMLLVVIGIIIYTEKRRMRNKR